MATNGGFDKFVKEGVKGIPICYPALLKENWLFWNNNIIIFIPLKKLNIITH
jgi:hypothetical protein